jgi:hypothetical protein
MDQKSSELIKQALINVPLTKKATQGNKKEESKDDTEKVDEVVEMKDF